MRKTVEAALLTAIVLAAALACVLPGAVQAQDILQEWDSIKAPPPPAIKPVTLDRKKTALISMDFNGKSCTPDKRARCAAVLPRAQKLIAEARAKGTFVVHTYTSNMEKSDIAKVVEPIAGEPVMRGRGDKFSGNDLEKILKDKGIETVVLIGTSANSAVLYTALGAAQRGFKAIVPIDTMPAETAYQEQFSIWQLANGSQVSENTTLTRSDMLQF
jgi:nicotinamidase-related amidase